MSGSGVYVLVMCYSFVHFAFFPSCFYDRAVELTSEERSKVLEEYKTFLKGVMKVMGNEHKEDLKEACAGAPNFRAQWSVAGM